MFIHVGVLYCFLEIWQLIPYTKYHIWKTFLLILVFCNCWLSLNKEVLVAEVFWPAGVNTWFTYKGLKLLKYLKVIELMQYSNRSLMGSQFFFSNSVRPIWALPFKFRQEQMHLFWSICNFVFNLLFRFGYQAEQAKSKWVCIRALRSSLQRVYDKNRFLLKL